MEVSYSRESTYASCPYKHWLRYIRRIKRKKPTRPLYFGSDFHTLLQYRGNKEDRIKAISQIKKTFEGLPVPYQEELGDDYIESLKVVFKDYSQYYKNDPIPDETEHWFEILIGKYQNEPVYFVGKIDEIYREEPVRLGEHKTFSREPELSTVVMNTQIGLYAKAYELEHGVMPEKVLWDYIRSKPAAYPVWLEKSGRFSEAASQSITPASWLRACKERGIDDPAILCKAQYYEPNISNFFFRYSLEINRTMANKLWDDFRDLAREIVIKGPNNKRKNVTRDCSYCDYKDICYAEFTGADVDYIIQKDFEEKEDNKNGEEVQNTD